MRARYLFAGVLIFAAACSSPEAERDTDARNEDPDLALTAPDAVPIASGVEMHREEMEREDEHGSPEPADVREAATPEPLGSAAEPASGGAAPGTAARQELAEAIHDHPKSTEPVITAADGESHAPGEEATGEGGKPTGISTGLGPVPGGNWGDPAIIDNPDPFGGTMTGIGRGGAVIIRGGAGGVDDDCAIHPRGGVAAVPTNGPGTLVNDRDPRRGTLINERAPRGGPQRPSLPRGGGFPRGIR